MTIEAIKKAISLKLKSKFPTHKIYTEEIPQGLKRPCFFIEILPINTSNVNKFHREKLINIDIQYFSINETNAENFTMIEELNDLINGVLEVEDRTFTIQQATTDIVDKILHYSFDLDFTDSLEGKIVNGEVILEELQLNYTEQSIKTMQELIIEEVN